MVYIQTAYFNGDRFIELDAYHNGFKYGDPDCSFSWDDITYMPDSVQPMGKEVFIHAYSTEEGNFSCIGKCISDNEWERKSNDYDAEDNNKILVGDTIFVFNCIAYNRTPIVIPLLEITGKESVTALTKFCNNNKIHILSLSSKNYCSVAQEVLTATKLTLNEQNLLLENLCENRYFTVIEILKELLQKTEYQNNSTVSSFNPFI